MRRSSFLPLSLFLLPGLLAACSQSSVQPADAAAITSLGEPPARLTAQAFDARTVPADHGRLRVSFIGDQPGLPRVGVRQVFLCGTGCVAVGATKSIAAPDDGRGTGELFSDSAFPAMRVDRIIVQPDPAAGEVVPFKTIRLAEPINVMAGARHEVFLTVRTVQTGAKRHLAVDYLADGQMPPTSADVVAYRPDRLLNAGGHFKLEPGSLPEATLLGLQTLDTGDVTSRVAVWPGTRLTKPAEVTLPVNEARLPTGLTWADYHVRVAGRKVGQPVVKGGAATFTTGELGDVQLATERLIVQADGERPVAVAEPARAEGVLTALSEDTSSCRTRLKSANTEIESLFAQGHSAVKTNACETSAPYMHVVVINRSDRDQTLHVPLVPVSGGYELRSIEQHGAGSMVAINATQWDGDYGVFAGGVGYPLWTLRTQNVNRKLTSNYEAFLAFQQQPADKSRGTSAEFHRGYSANSTLSGSATPSVNFNTHTYHVLGSTTSIVANGACSRSPGTTRETWSAAGIGLNRMVLASTTSDASTNDYEICAIFEALGYMNGALRLDGGGAAAMAWNGVHLNPLTGTNYLKYGNFRYLLNAMVWK